MSGELREFPRPTTLAVPFDPKVDHFIGPADGKLLLVEYGDYECPDCGRAYPLIKTLQQRFDQRLTFVFRHFPQYTVHRHASTAALAAEAAAAQGQFWKMHDLLYGDQAHLDMADFTHHALRLGLDPYRFDADLGSGQYEKRVEKDFLGGQNSGVRGTPTLFINGNRYTSTLEMDAIAAALEAAGQSG